MTWSATRLLKLFAASPATPWSPLLALALALTLAPLALVGAAHAQSAQTLSVGAGTVLLAPKGNDKPPSLAPRRCSSRRRPPASGTRR
jgi:hypothetical protein